MTHEKSDPLLRFWAGGLSGCVAKTVVAPLDRVKILMQGQKMNFHNLGPFKALKVIYSKDGIVGLFQGNFTQLVRVFPYSATQFLSFGLYNDVFNHFGIKATFRLEKFLSGSLAGITACCVTYPLDLIRARIAFQDKAPKRNVFLVKNEKVSSNCSFDGPNVKINSEKYVHKSRNIKRDRYHYRGISHAFKSILKENGVKGLYKGFVPTIIGMAPYAGASFYTFETMKTVTNERGGFPLVTETNKNGNKVKYLSVYGNLVCGTVAGLVAQTISYPLDVVRRVMQLNANKGDYHKSDGRRRTWFSVMRIIFIKYGVRKGLFRGMTINYIRVVPVVAVSFTIFESLTK